MSRYESIQKSIYDDLEDLPRDAFDLYLWSFINHRCNLAGLYHVSERAMLESKVPRKQLRVALRRLAAEDLMFHHTGVLWVKARIKRLTTYGPKIAQPVFRDVANIPATNPLRTALIDYYTRELPERGEDYGWLSPLLLTLNVVPHSADEVLALDGSSDGASGCRDGSIALGKGLEEEKNLSFAEFKDWLEFHQRTTGQLPPNERTAVFGEARGMFLARREEGYSPDDLKLAVLGAFNDDHRREHGYFGVISVLRPTKVHDLVAKGRESKKPPPGQNVVHMARKCRRCSGETEHGAAFCEGCAEIVAGGGDAA